MKKLERTIVFLSILILVTGFIGWPKPDKAAAGNPIYKESRPQSKNLDKREIPSNKNYVYSPHGKTDPFKAYVVEDKPLLKQLGKSRRGPRYMDVEIKTELQRHKISDLVIKGMIGSEDKTVAMVQVEGSGAGHFLKVGTLVGRHGGKVKEIVALDPDISRFSPMKGWVVIKVPYLDSYGQKKYEEVKLYFE